MSLDVYLKTNCETTASIEKIIIREGGRTKEISLDEWNRRYPNKSPLFSVSDNNTVYSANITHNLGEMASRAGIYEYLWRPDEINIVKANQLIIPLQIGLKVLGFNSEYFKTFNPSNGWGDYNRLVEFVREYLHACKQYPNAEVYVSR